MKHIIKVVATHALLAGVIGAVGTVIIDIVKLAKADAF